LVGQSGFVSSRVTPRVQEVAGPVVDHIVNRANEALAQIVEHQAIWQYRPSGAGKAAEAFEDWTDLAAAAGPLVGGVAAAVPLPAMAVTTSTAVFRLVTTTVVSWPVVVGGGALADIAIATGLLNKGRIWDKTESRLRDKVRQHVVATLLLGSAKEPSILEQLEQTFADAAKQAKKL
jgi:hypothetical protein